MAKNFTMTDQLVIEDAVSKALQEIATHYGASVEITKSRFSASEGSLVVRFTSAGADDANALSFKAWADKFGFKPEDHGRQFEFRGSVYTAVKLDPQKIKYPLIAERLDGKRFKFPAQTGFTKYKWVV